MENIHLYLKFVLKKCFFPAKKCFFFWWFYAFFGFFFSQNSCTTPEYGIVKWITISFMKIPFRHVLKLSYTLNPSIFITERTTHSSRRTRRWWRRTECYGLTGCLVPRLEGISVRRLTPWAPSPRPPRSTYGEVSVPSVRHSGLKIQHWSFHLG